MRVAAIDIGTNSIRLLKAEIENGQLRSGPKALNMTRIGEGVNETGVLSEAGMQRSVDALVGFEAEAKAWGAQKIFALATSAVRDAGNRDEFLNRVKKACGLEIEVISGEQEAKIGFLGVLAGVEDVEGSILVIDVGGGSTELIVGDAGGIMFAHSANVGAVRMTGKHITTDPIADSEYDAVMEDIALITKDVLADLKEHKIAIIDLFGRNPCKRCLVAPMCQVVCRDSLRIPSGLRRFMSFMYLLSSFVFILGCSLFLGVFL